MQGHCYPEHIASALTSQLNYRLTLSCSVIVVVYFVCAHLHNSNSVHYLLWCCVQSMSSIIAVVNEYYYYYYYLYLPPMLEPGFLLALLQTLTDNLTLWNFKQPYSGG